MFSSLTLKPKYKRYRVFLINKDLVRIRHQNEADIRLANEFHASLVAVSLLFVFLPDFIVFLVFLQVSSAFRNRCAQYASVTSKLAYDIKRT